MRDGFREIASGWMLVDDTDLLAERLEKIKAWSFDNAPLHGDELACVGMMIEVHDARAASEELERLVSDVEDDLIGGGL